MAGSGYAPRRDGGSDGGAAKGPASRASERDRRIQVELATHLVRQAPTGFALGTFAVAAIVAVLWIAAPPAALAAWVAVIAALSMPAAIVVGRFMRSSDVPAHVLGWERALIAAYGLAGAGWGAAAVLLYPVLDPPDRLFVLFVTGAAAISGMAALAPVRLAFVAYVTTTLLPITGVLLLEGSLPSIATGLLILAFWATSLSLAANLRGRLVEALRLRYENLELIGDLSRAKDEAEAASRAKSVLLANVSHELRTPLALILGPTRKLLSAGAGDDRARRDLETVERNALALSKHLGDLLDLAKLDTGRMEIRRSPVDVAALVRRTASLFDVVASERRIAVALRASETLPAVVDGSKLERVLLNLLSNAMKFAPDGGHVWVDARRDDGNVVITVEDDGPGVPPQSRRSIFEPFRRGDDAAARAVGGTGLGLAIAHEIVERHGGRIGVEDGASGGARFRVSVPARVAARAAPAEPVEHAAPDEIAQRTVGELRRPEAPVAAVHGSPGRALVLVVEDNPDMSRFLVDCLTPDHRVATEFDGSRGLERAVALQPDLILTDLMLPGLDGDVLVRALRARPELDGTPILVLTAKADDELRVSLLREGVQDFLTKPVTPEELRARVANFVMMKRTRDVLQGALSSRSRDLASLADQLAAANRAKDEFLAILSHELRTPLMPILAWAGLMREHRLDAATTERGLAAIERSATHQVRIVEDLLDVSRAITGKLRLEMKPVVLDAVIRGAVDSVRPAAEAKGIALEIESSPDAGLVSGDPDRLRQVVWNLLSNAIKFTPKGGRVALRVAHADDRVSVTVRDEGIGIAPALLPRLFERFWQGDTSSTRAHGGLGLGLAVVRHLVELHGGTVAAASDGLGRGATFTVTLPASEPREADHEMPASRVAPVLTGRKVMVVDDDLETGEIVGAILAGAGAEVRTCASASQALAAMDAWVPDILVSDIAMPDEDGYAFIRKVRARKAEDGGALVAVALTAYAGHEDRLKALSAGYQMHVGKPVDPRQLVRVVASATGSHVDARQ